MTDDFASPEYGQALDQIYMSFLKAKPYIEGRRDSEVRSPEIVVGIAQKLGIMPEPTRTIRITGSKGKGTTTRLAASIAAALSPTSKVGCFVSPEEFEHTDRMQIDGVAISVADFVRIYSGIRGALAPIEECLTGHQYISPFGQFLLVALTWFKENGVDFFVLETGRGARFDDVGQLPSIVSIITSIFEEHPESLGPLLRDIAWNKAGLFDNSEVVFVSEQANAVLVDNGLGYGVTVERPDGPLDTQMPQWVALDYALAWAAVTRLLTVPSDTPLRNEVRLVSASFGTIKVGTTEFIYDATINIASLDMRYLEGLKKRYGNVRVLASLPDDKDRGELLNALRSWGSKFEDVALTGTRGYLHYSQALASDSVRIVGMADVQGFVRLLGEASEEGAGAVYIVGTQSYIRLAKMALGQMI